MANAKQCAAVVDLFESCFERVYGFARKHTDPETAEEVTQEVFVRLLSLQDFENKDLSVSYLIKIADNLLKRRHKRQVKLRQIADDLARESPELGAMTARRGESCDRVECAAALGQLSDDEHEAVRLIVCQGLSYEDAARSLGVEVSTVNNWKYRGIQKLKHHTGAERGRRGEDRSERRGRARQRALPEGPFGRDE